MSGRTPVIEFRRFRNSDPPHVRRLWQTCGLGRGAAQDFDSDAIETVVFAQPYFDPAGLILACAGDDVVGYVHAGFAATDQGSRIGTHDGVIAAVMVRPEYRRRGIGRELVQRGESYLRERGATSIRAGQAEPFDPFYVGMYGGSQPAGFLESDPDAAPFFSALGYQPEVRRLIYQRSLEVKGEPVGLRLMTVRKATKLAVPPASKPSWWWQTRTGRLDTVTLALVPKAGGGAPVAQVTVVALDYYLPCWQQRSIGLVDLHVPEEHRRKGYAQALLVEVCRRVKAELITLVEAHVDETNVAGVRTLTSAGFMQVDAGVVYRAPA